jgi:RNA-directed DNA polymerase
MPERYSSGSVSTRLCRIAEVARRSPEMVITTLAHHIDLAWMYEAYRQTRKGGAVGVDKVGAEEYASDLESNLRSLLDRFKSGTYYAPPVRRVEIPKGDGKAARPIGVPTFEDKVLQRAVAMVLEAVYEQDFCDCSYGFRPGRSAHDALDALWKGLMEMRGGWVVDLDISKFFDSLDHRKLREILDTRVRDGVIRRAIDKWLKAGVMKEGLVERPASGTPQGGVISPVLANIYLHVVIGHCRYYGITGNSVSIGRFRKEVERAWRGWLNRRSQRAGMTWARFRKLSRRYPLPPAIACHSVCRA